MLGRPFGHARTRRRVGFLAENVSLYQRPADSLVRFYGALNGLRGAALKKRTIEVLAEVGLGAEAKRNVKGFSRGMLQRVGLAQAIVNDPELLILDEPTSALDPRARVIVRELLMNFRSQGKTIFLSSHLLSEVELVCDRVAILNRGRMVRLGTTASLLESSHESEIVARGVSADSFGGVTLTNGDIRIAVPTNQQRALVERVWQAGGEIISINPVRKSLEQLFLELTNLPEEKGTAA
jgi:ABC-2 type transport system ATP-binding protein